MKRSYIRTRPREVIADVINILLMGVFALLCVYPFYYVIINAISDNDAVAAGLVWLLPKGIHFQNFAAVSKLNGISRAALISVLRTVIGTAAMMLSSSVLGYAMTRKEYWHRKFWYRFLIITMYFSAGIIPCYMNIRRLGLLNSFWVYILPSMAAPYNMILVKTYIESIPSALEEAAIIDGAGYFARFTKIIIPLCKPILATIAVFGAVTQWNSFMDTVLYMTGNDYRTLQSLLNEYMNQAGFLTKLLQEGGNAAMTTQIGKALNIASIRHTITAVTLLPILAVYPFFQRFFTKGIMIGAVKG